MEFWAVPGWCVMAIGCCRPGIAGIVIVMPDPVLLLYCARLGVPAWTGEAEDQVLRHARGPRRLLDGGRGPGAVVRLGLDHPPAPAAGALFLRQFHRASGGAVYRDPL